MSDELTRRAPADRTRINIAKPWELLYWCNELGTTENRLIAAVRDVGALVDNVREHLRQQKTKAKPRLTKEQVSRIKIPTDLDFSALNLRRDLATHKVSYDWAPIVRICLFSGLDITVVRDGHKKNAPQLILEWYSQHLARGGAPDPTQDQFFAEAEAEALLGAWRVQAGSPTRQ